MVSRANVAVSFFITMSGFITHWAYGRKSLEGGRLKQYLARRLGRGLLVTCDYGFERAKLLDARVRRHGTLACYRSQRVHRDPFVAS